ncbi:MotB family protein [Fulvimarina sp. 2208YS6-2-32]|uniref:MotB family protein n=1 Tax=Fulvimarina uroteuthidis TaxID=3098149 RepID=A0ABU5I1G3_9HYPH|nr:MotB family protein [Fulvimarina sp. 2208YS6-2-32]MDY8109061.1 MotB family protein [Fulvimarina sp. 2208YS6-2-32]
MSDAGHRDHQEIIIVKRRGGAHDEHHGGVWKIAFADFMTAMMAFFLVMWLTNSTDESTRTQVAQYFNPIQMTDSAPTSRGVDQKNVQSDVLSETEGALDVQVDGTPGGQPMAGDETGGEEQAMFRDPYAVLAEIAANSTSSGSGEREGVPDGSGLPGMNGGEAYRDPFDPQSWQLSPNMVESGGAVEDLPPPEFKTAVLPPEGAAASEGEAAAGGEIAASALPPEAAAEGEAETEAAPETEASAVADLKSDIEAELGQMGEGVPANVEVSQGEEGIMISLSDDFDSGMFSVGSAKPNGEAVAMMEKIANVLKTRAGRIVVRGHTDARPFKSENYDNWRLSTARAHMAYYMLTRGGLETERFQAIEGFADRKPKDAANPESDVNRRIEILLVEDV